MKKMVDKGNEPTVPVPSTDCRGTRVEFVWRIRVNISTDLPLLSSKIGHIKCRVGVEVGESWHFEIPKLGCARWGTRWVTLVRSLNKSTVGKLPKLWNENIVKDRFSYHPTDNLKRNPSIKGSGPWKFRRRKTNILTTHRPGVWNTGGNPFEGSLGETRICTRFDTNTIDSRVENW